MKPSDLHHLTAAYALDALDPVERQEFEAHYPTCEICNREVGEFRATAAILADGVALKPPPELKAGIMAEIERTRQLPPLLPGSPGAGSNTGSSGPDSATGDLRVRRDRTSRWTGTAAKVLAGAAAAVLVVVGAVTTIQVAGDDGDDIAELIAAADADFDTLAQQEQAPGRLQIVWSAGQAKLGVIGDGLDQPGPGSTYALWLVEADGGVVPAGLFEPDERGSIRSVLNLDRTDAAGWGVTIEPDGGSPQPTSPILYLTDEA